ncbi:MAG: hypothetical protein K0U59_01220 [Gammaproteobacteria bacterium]|nr:hypothetical protein [Gammaproteobacteria bacterium]
MPLPSAKYRQHASRALLEKTLSELLFEDALRETQSDNGYCLLLSSGIHYRFNATPSIWGQLLIVKGSVSRNGASAYCPLQLLIDAQQELGADDIILANLLEEMSNTLIADSYLIANRDTLNAKTWAELEPDLLQSYLDGHPKAIANKGRMHWGVGEHQQFAPEHGQTFQLHWLATQSDVLKTNFNPNWNSLKLLKQTLKDNDFFEVAKKLKCTEAELENWQFIPVHPWQWEHKIQTLFADLLAEKQLFHLGKLGDYYLAQPSLRTLANRERPGKLDIKLPVTLLNTSCYRGIPEKYIGIGAEVSDWLHQLTEQDPILSNTLVLRELAGLHYPHPLFQQIAHPPYRYNEMLGAIWRENVQSRLPNNQRGIMLGALWQCDNQGNPLIKYWLHSSGLTLEQWLTALFQQVVVPLYHLLCCYGVGLIAHGQNITVILQSGRPVGVALKDFQGDMRLLDKTLSQQAGLGEKIMTTLERLPADHLIQDLQTGHFVTALRFLSAELWQSLDYPEIMFYRILSEVIRQYQADNQKLQARFSMFNLFTPKIPKLCMNRARFKIGYGDNSERPQLILGAEIPNPLYLSEQKKTDNTGAVNSKGIHHAV